MALWILNVDIYERSLIRQKLSFESKDSSLQAGSTKRTRDIKCKKLKLYGIDDSMKITNIKRISANVHPIDIRRIHLHSSHPILDSNNRANYIQHIALNSSRKNHTSNH